MNFDPSDWDSVKSFIDAQTEKHGFLPGSVYMAFVMTGADVPKVDAYLAEIKATVKPNNLE